jgi:hypothetical protein
VSQNGELKIESGIPVPDPLSGRNNKGYRDALRKLGVTDSVVIPTSGGYIVKLAREILGPGNYATRKAEGGYRVWRTK